MGTFELVTGHLRLVPLPVAAAATIADDRASVSGALGAELSPEWPAPDLFGVLGRHALSPAGMERFGVWVMIERASMTVVGDIGFHGPPDDTGTVEIGYSVVPSRRGRGYATEAAAALIKWARAQLSVRVVVAGCDPSNTASVRTLERTGFHRTGEAGGELRWRHGAEDEER